MPSPINLLARGKKNKNEAKSALREFVRIRRFVVNVHVFVCVCCVRARIVYVCISKMTPQHAPFYVFVHTHFLACRRLRKMVDFIQPGVRLYIFPLLSLPMAAHAHAIRTQTKQNQTKNKNRIIASDGKWHHYCIIKIIFSWVETGIWKWFYGCRNTTGQMKRESKTIRYIPSNDFIWDYYHCVQRRTKCRFVFNVSRFVIFGRNHTGPLYIVCYVYIKNVFISFCKHRVHVTHSTGAFAFGMLEGWRRVGE